MTRKTRLKKAIRRKKREMKKREKRLHAACAREIKEGITRIGDVYRLTGRHPLVCYIDTRKARMYIARTHRQRLKSFFGAKEKAKGSWMIEHGRVSGNFEIAPIEELDMQGVFDIGCIGYIYGMYCTESRPGMCTNFYDVNTGEFTFSAKWGSYQRFCAYDSTGYCGESWTNVMFQQVYREPGCTGFSVANQRQWVLTC